MKPEDLGTYYESILEKEVRKEGGVYYTPPLIVEYMVANSVGIFLKGKKPAEVTQIKIVDTACGGGVFLLGAYQFLLDWYEKHYGKLTLRQRGEILIDHIFGVDIDPLAVEITKYGLAMKYLEGKDFSLDLDNNIRCGNSLVDTEFHWQREFPHVFKQGGFDIVIGNPPYGAKYSDQHKKYFLEHYETAQTIKNTQKGSLDTFALFIEKGHRLCKTIGYLHFIIPISVTSSDSMTGVHRFLEKSCSLIKVSSYAVRPQPVFENSVVNTSILFCKKDGKQNEQILATKMYRKSKDFDLEYLFKHLRFIDVKDVKLRGRYPKISLPMEKRILKKVLSQPVKIKDIVQESGSPIYYRTTGGRYFKVITNYSTGSTKENSICFNSKIRDAVGAVLSSNLFFWFYQVFSNNLDLKMYEIESFGFPYIKFDSQIIGKIRKLYGVYLHDIERNAMIKRTERYANIDSFKEYQIGKSKHLIDKIDDIICPLYGLTQKETDFIKNYEIKYRLSDNS